MLFRPIILARAYAMFSMGVYPAEFKFFILLTNLWATQHCWPQSGSLKTVCGPQGQHSNAFCDRRGCRGKLIHFWICFTWWQQSQKRWTSTIDSSIALCNSELWREASEGKHINQMWKWKKLEACVTGKLEWCDVEKESRGYDAKSRDALLWFSSRWVKTDTHTRTLQLIIFHSLHTLSLLYPPRGRVSHLCLLHTHSCAPPVQTHTYT